MPRFFDKTGNEIPESKVRNWAIKALRRYLIGRVLAKDLSYADSYAIEFANIVGTDFEDTTIDGILEWRRKRGAFRKVVKALRKRGVHTGRK